MHVTGAICQLSSRYGNYTDHVRRHRGKNARFGRGLESHVVQYRRTPDARAGETCDEVYRMLAVLRAGKKRHGYL